VEPSDEWDDRFEPEHYQKKDVLLEDRTKMR
jgi:hypothetical protein